MSRRQAIVLVLLALALAAGFRWLAPSGEEREIRRRLDELVTTFNTGADDGMSAVTRAARLGAFFTDDVIIELGRGSLPIQGRDTVMGMAARLQPRTAEFALALHDVTIEQLEEDSAELSLTGVISQQAGSARETLDAREFSLTLRKAGAVWQVSRVEAIDTLR